MKTACIISLLSCLKCRTCGKWADPAHIRDDREPPLVQCAECCCGPKLFNSVGADGFRAVESQVQEGLF